MSTDRIIESAREVARVWTHMRDTSHPHHGTTNESLSVVLDELVRRCSEPSPGHHTWPWRKVVPGGPENGHQPEIEYVWSCRCREGESSGDMNSMAAALEAANSHRADPTQFPGWLS